MPINDKDWSTLSGVSAGLQSMRMPGLNFDRFLECVIAAAVADSAETSDVCMGRPPHDVP
jgi:hypothetical protein